MSDGNRGVILAFAGLAALFTAFGSGLYLGLLPQAEQHRTESQSASSDARQSPAPSSYGAGVASPPASDFKPSPDNQAYYTREDLKAQREMAWWTKVMGWAAGIGILLGAVSIWLIWRTWDATREAAKSGDEANRIAREGNRAWIKLIPGEEGILRKHPDGVGLHIDLMIENVGTKPAIRVWTDAVLSLDDMALALMLDDLGKVEPKIGHAFTILYPKACEGTAHILECNEQIPTHGRLYVLIYCLYTIPGLEKPRYVADILEIAPKQPSTLIYGMKEGMMSLQASANTHLSEKVCFKRSLGVSPRAT